VARTVKKQEDLLKEQVELSEQQLTAIEHLIVGSTKKGAAEAVGVAPYTVSRWFQQPEFMATLNERRQDIYEANTERLRSLAAKALDVVEDALDSDSESVRLKAASQVLKAVGLADVMPPGGPVTPEAARQQAAFDAILNFGF
jgi:hypothetical protein